MILSIPDRKGGRRKTALSVKLALPKCGPSTPMDSDPPGNTHDEHAADPDTSLDAVAPYRSGLLRPVRRLPPDRDGRATIWTGTAAVAEVLPVMAAQQAEGAA